MPEVRSRDRRTVCVGLSDMGSSPSATVGCLVVYLGFRLRLHPRLYRFVAVGDRSIFAALLGVSDDRIAPWGSFVGVDVTMK